MALKLVEVSGRKEEKEREKRRKERVAARSGGTAAASANKSTQEFLKEVKQTQEGIVVGSAVMGQPNSVTSATLSQIRRTGRSGGGISRADILRASQAAAKTQAEVDLRKRLVQEAKLKAEAARRNMDLQDLIIAKELRKNGLNPIISNGQVQGFSSSATGRSYSYTQEGIDQFNRDAFSSSLKPATFKQIVEADKQTGVSVQGTSYSRTVDKNLNSLLNTRVQLNKKLSNVKKEVNKLKSQGKRGQAALLAAKNLPLIFDSMATEGSLAIWEVAQAAPLIIPTVITIARNPKTIIPIGKEVARGVFIEYPMQVITLAKVAPERAVARIGTDLFALQLVDDGVRILGKYSGRAALRLNPYFKSLRKGVITVRVGKVGFIKRGRSVYLAIKKGKTGEILDAIKGSRKKVTLEKGTIGAGETLAKQASLAGTKGTIVTAQADNLLAFTKRIIKRKDYGRIRKPIPGEENLATKTKALLRKFDNGTITNKEFYRLNKQIYNQTGKTILERSLYADPKGVIRFTRLGENVAEANFGDILRGNFTLKRQKPVVFVFPEGQIASWPRYLQSIYRKIKANKTLTFREDALLKKWQVSTKGKSGTEWKPIGDIRYKGGKELEVTLAPGNFIRKVKRIAVTEINGIKVPIIQAKVIRLKAKTAKLLNKAKKTKLNDKEAGFLRRALKSETGESLSIKEIKNLSRNIRRRPLDRPYFAPRRIITKGSVRASRGLKRTVRKTSRVSRRTTRISRAGKRTTRTRRVIPRSRARGKTTTTRARARVPATRARARPKAVRGRGKTKGRTRTPPVRATREFKARTLSKPVQTYYVVEKVRGKYKKLYPKPLKTKDARDYAVYSIDNNLSKTAFFIPLGKRKVVVQPPKNIQGYYSANRQKVRPYRIRYGQKKLLVNGYIEKRKYFQDTQQERLQAARLRAKKASNSRKRGQRTKQTTKTKRPSASIPSRKATPAQLRALKKARAARKRRVVRKKK